MKLLLFLSLIFGNSLFSCTSLQKTNKEDITFCKELKVKLESLISIDAISKEVYFDESLKIDSSEMRTGQMRFTVSGMKYQSDILSNKSIYGYIGEKKNAIKKMFKIDQLPDSNEYRIHRTLEHARCFQNLKDCKTPRNYLNLYPHFLIEFSTSDTISDVEVVLNSNHTKLIFR